MGRRSRKRGAGSPVSADSVVRERAAERPAPRAPTRKARLEEAPKPVWAPFPLTELCILASLVLLVIGFVSRGDGQTRILLAGFALVSLAAGELALREHFAGYRSHSSLLAGICAILAVVPIYLVGGLPRLVPVGIGIAVFAVAFSLLRGAFAARSGGLGFRA